MNKITDYEKKLMKDNIKLCAVIRKQHKRIDIFFLGLVAGMAIQFIYMAYIQ